MEKAQLSKLSLPTVGDPEELLQCGTLEYYDKAYDRVRKKLEFETRTRFLGIQNNMLL